MGVFRRRTTLVTIWCISVLLGVAASRRVVFSAEVVCISFVLCVACIWWRSRYVLIILVVFGFCLGVWRGDTYMQALHDYRQYYGHKVVLQAVALNDGVYGKQSQMSFDASNVVVMATGQHLKGKLSVSAFGVNAVYQGDTIIASGSLRPSLGSYQGRISFAELQLARQGGTPVTRLRQRFVAGLQSALPEPLASFGLGLLVGQRNTLPEAVSHSLLTVGLTHIIAVSGYNLTILMQASRRLFSKSSKYQTTVFSVGLIGLFLLFSGASASIVRAAIVSLLSIAAWCYGRSFKPLVLITLSAAITALANPFYEWSDLGWYLSFLAFYGVLVLAPAVRARFLHGWFARSGIVAVIVESLCAEAMSLPLILHFFGQASLVGLLGNLLIATMVPLAMLLTLIAGLAGMFAPMLAGWLAWPGVLVLTYQLDTASLLSRIPHSFIEHIGFSTGMMLGAYAVVLYMSWLLNRQKRSKSGIITDRRTTSIEGANI